jgi:hypothetical protein
MDVAISHAAPDMAQDVIEHGDVRANSMDGSHRQDRGERARTGQGRP